MPTEFVKHDRTARLLRVSGLLSHHPHGITAKQVADRTGMTVRTAYRDIRALEAELGLPIWEEEGRFGVLEGAFLPPLNLTLSEAVALYLSARLMARFSDRRDDSVIRAFGSLAAVLPTPIAQHIYATVATIGERPADQRHAEVMAALVGGWADGKLVDIHYVHTDAEGQRHESERSLAPYFIEPHPAGHSCYVLGLDSLSGELRTFKIERIQSATLMDDSFTVPDDFDPQQRLRDSWVVTDERPTEVRLLFHDPSAAERARENRWHTSQREIAREDGKLELRFIVAGLVEILSWVLGWGDAVEVLQPSELRARLAKTARSMAARYA